MIHRFVIVWVMREKNKKHFKFKPLGYFSSGQSSVVLKFFVIALRSSSLYTYTTQIVSKFKRVLHTPSQNSATHAQARTHTRTHSFSLSGLYQCQTWKPPFFISHRMMSNVFIFKPHFSFQFKNITRKWCLTMMK